MNLTIEQLNPDNSRYLPHEFQPFDIIGRFVPMYDGKSWSHSEILFDEHRQKTYEATDDYSPEEYIGSDSQTIFLAIAGGECVGMVRISQCWFGYGYIDDIMVDREYRHIGIGVKLLDAASAWCRAHKLQGIVLETQDNNLQACRFYTKYGFKLCGVNTEKYSLTKYKDEISLYFKLNL